MGEKSRVQKILAAWGVSSRRKAEEMISAGRVTVNGHMVSLGDSADPKRDSIELDGQRLSPGGKKLYYVMYKPRGYITTMSDERDRKCVAQLMGNIGARVYPVGRLDKDSEGLLLLTNDGDFANIVTHPKGHIAKTYRVTVRPGITEDQLSSIASGVMIDGRMTAPAKVRVLEQQGERVVLEIVLYEGRNREIRKMCEALGLEVARLKRIAEGPVRLGMLRQGAVRELTGEEVKGLIAEAKLQGGSKRDRDTAHEGQTTGRRTAQTGGRSR